jgi:ABC-2 type transport system ATP-binding protein
MEQTTVVEVEALEHRYGQHQALAGISFAVRRGEIFGLLGPNGGGKTTLFRLLSTLLVPSGGTARIFGCDVTERPAAIRSRLGVVFQAPSLDVKLTAAENLWHQGHLYGLSGKPLKERIDELLRQVGLAERARDRVETFSGGMQRRLEVAKGLLHRPALLLLDEPSTGLDPGARRDLWTYLTRWSDTEDVTILVTTHLMEEAEHCDRLAILDRGHVVALGSPAELKQEIGGDVISLQTNEPQQLSRRIRERFDVEPTLLNGTLRIEHSQGHELVGQLMEFFGAEIESVTLGKPSLDDVFIRRTGHRFWHEAMEEAS